MRMLAMFWLVLGLATIGASPGEAASVYAAGLSYEQSASQTHPSSASADISRQGPGAPGSSAASADAVFGALDGMTTHTGCGFAVNNFQQVCNQSNSGSSFTDAFTILASAPNGTPVQVRGTLALYGSIDGIGAYSYRASAEINGDARAMQNNTGGGVVNVGHLSLDDVRVWTVNLVVGGTYSVSGSLETGTANRYCAGGTQDCDASDSDWQMTVDAGSRFQLEILTPDIDAQIVAQSGHDYLVVPVAVAQQKGFRLRLDAPWPNPSRGPVSISLALAAPSLVDVGVFDLAGRRVATLARQTMPAGVRTLGWDGRDSEGREATGAFFIRAKAPGLDATRRVMVIR